MGRLVNEYGSTGMGITSVGTAIGDPTGGVDFFIDRYGKPALEAIEKRVARWYGGDKGKESTYNCDGPARPNPSADKPFFTCLNPIGNALSCPPGFSPEWVDVLWSGSGYGSPNDFDYSRYITSGVQLAKRTCMRVRAPTANEARNYARGWRPKDSVDAGNKTVVKRRMIQTKGFRDTPKRRLVAASRGGRVLVETLTPTEGLIPLFPDYENSPYRDKNHRDYPRYWHEMMRWNELEKEKEDLRFEREKSKLQSQRTTHSSTAIPAVPSFTPKSSQSPATLIMVAAVVGAVVLLWKAK